MNANDGLKLLLTATAFAAAVVGVFGWIACVFWIKTCLKDWGPADVMRRHGVCARLILALLCVAVLVLTVWALGWMTPKGFYNRWSSALPSLRSDLAVVPLLWLGLLLGSLIGAYASQFLAFRAFKKFRRVPLLTLARPEAHKTEP